MLVEFMEGGMQGESSNTGAAEDNLEAANAKQTYVCDPQAVHNMTENGEVEEYGPYMEADQGEEDKRIVEQIEADDAEQLVFVDEFVGRSFDDETYIPEDWAHIAPDAMTVDDCHHSLWEYAMIEMK